MMLPRLFFLGLLFLPITSFGHHAVANVYDPREVIEIEGEVTKLLWRNPHVVITVSVRNNSGEVEVWDMATTSLSNLRRWQIDPNFIEIGDTIRVAGNPARRGVGMYISHVLTTGGEEVLLAPSAEPRWSDRVVEMAESRRLGIGDTSAPELGIFRIWSTPDNIPTLIPRNLGQTPSGRANLTEAALQSVDAFVWERDNPLQNCAPKGMPLIMHAPYPFEFVRDGDNILWHNEEYDTVRTIHMATDASPEGQPDSLLGYSVGRWEDNRTLVVTTTHMNWGHLDGQGIPASTVAETVERFAVSPQGDRLDYSMTFTDPENLIEPMTFGKHWIWYPDAEVNEYDCSRAAEN